MKAIQILTLMTALVLGMSHSSAQTADSVDVFDYDISLDLSAERPFHGDALLTLQLLRPCQSISLQLIGVADSVEMAGTRIESPSLAALPTAGIAPNTPFTIRVWYTGNGYVEPGEWGGFHFDNDMSYNLGVGFSVDPHVIGRAVFPCRDNFDDKATYTLRVKTKPGWTAECGGHRQSTTIGDDGSEQSVWRIDLPTPTYLVSVSQAAFSRIQDTIPSLYGTYPLTLGYINRNSSLVQQAFAELDSVVPMFERCFGPYRWGRIGYIATRKGSMEHVNNIALDRSFMTSTSERAQSTIAHELGHAWFGNLVTCATEADMWINEGGASFCSEVAMESVLGRQASDDYYQRNLERVIRTTHITDGGHHPLTPMPHHLTYGSTTYEKGWMVWHSLRGYLGENLFYQSMQRLMASCAFSNIDAYRLRDSLSLYSGVDLTDFFRFHVFGQGFINYHLNALMGPSGCDPRYINVMVNQRGVGTDSIMASIRIPVTFFSHNLDTAKVWFSSSDTVLDEVYTLPFVPAFCVLDYDNEISDAATTGSVHMPGYPTTLSLPTVHAAFNSATATDIFVEHHWGLPWGSLPYGVIRPAQRYWVLNGLWNHQDGIKGQFRYIRGNSGNYPYLDQGFYWDAASRDSLALLYRPTPDSQWTVIPHTLSGSANEGYLIADSIAPGEYTLAIVDTQMLDIPHRHPPLHEANLFPNPLRAGEELTVEVPTDTPFILSIFDTEGRLVWQKNPCHNRSKIKPTLAKGTYFVRIENNFLSLQSKLIQL